MAQYEGSGGKPGTVPLTCWARLYRLEAPGGVRDRTVLAWLWSIFTVAVDRYLAAAALVLRGVDFCSRAGKTPAINNSVQPRRPHV